MVAGAGTVSAHQDRIAVLSETPSVAEAPPSTEKASARTRAVNAIRTALVVLVVIAATWQLVSHWQQVADTILHLQWHRAIN